MFTEKCLTVMLTLMRVPFKHCFIAPYWNDVLNVIIKHRKSPLEWIFSIKHMMVFPGALLAVVTRWQCCTAGCLACAEESEE